MRQMTYLFSGTFSWLPCCCRVTVTAGCQQISFALDKLPSTTHVHVHNTAYSVEVDCDGDLTAVVGSCEELVAHAKHCRYLFVLEACHKLAFSFVRAKDYSQCDVTSAYSMATMLCMAVNRDFSSLLFKWR